MRTLVIEHQADTGAGVIGEVLAERGPVAVWRSPVQAPPQLSEFDALLVLGGGMHPDQDDAHPWLARERRLLEQALEARLPTLGICLGHELLAQAGGGGVARAPQPEIGWYEVELTAAGLRDPLLSSLPPRFPAFEWHSYLARPPGRAEVLAENAAGVQALRLGERAWSIQFHAEVTGPIAQGWIDDCAVDRDAVAMGLDAGRLAEQTKAHLEAWNELGRCLAERFGDLCRHFIAASPLDRGAMA